MQGTPQKDKLEQWLGPQQTTGAKVFLQTKKKLHHTWRPVW